MIGLNSQSDPDELIRAEGSNQRLDSVVPRRPAALFNSQRAERKIKLVVNDNQSVCRLDLELIDQLAHRETAQVHEGLWLSQHDLVPGDLRLSRCRLTSAAGDIDVRAFGETIDRQESEIVRRELVLDARIAETDNQLHSYFLPSAFLPPSALPPASGAASSVSCLPFLMTSGSAGAAAASAPASAGAASTTSFTDVMCATGCVSSVTNLILPLCGRSETRSTCPKTSAVTSSSI